MVNGPAILVLAAFTSDIVLLLAPLLWMLGKTMAKAAYKREELGFPPSWYDGILMWEFERLTDKEEEKHDT